MNENDLPKLKGSKRKFVMYLANNCKSASEAYRCAYNTKNMNRASVWKEASKLLKDPHVTPWLQWIEENQTEVAKTEVRYNREQAIYDADELLLMALECKDKNGNPNVNSALKAFELKNRLVGNFEEDNKQRAGEFKIMGSVMLDEKELDLKVGKDVKGEEKQG